MATMSDECVDDLDMIAEMVLSGTAMTMIVVLIGVTIAIAMQW